MINLQTGVFGEEEENRRLSTLHKKKIHYTLNGGLETGYKPVGSVKFCEERGIDIRPYNCSSYYPYIKHLLNDNYILIEYNKISDKLFKLFDTDRLFIRPDSGHKIFTGTTVGRKHLRAELDIIKTDWDVTDNTLCLVAPAKDMYYEYRCFVLNGELKTMSSYTDYGSSDFIDDLPAQIQPIVQKCDKLPSGYIMDVTFTANNEPKIIEVNCVNSSGWYDMNYHVILEYLVQK